MYLKAIEINGFKSFGEKKYIEFNKGITSIVGPNGSGKSNILDAVIWVLGEHSYKNIRAKDSQDVIYSGKKNINRAEVSLVIDNSEKFFELNSSELKITRRLYKNGEGEYLINDNKCRLKDIIDLFLDTGIGKSAYSVIGQGKVDRIINSNPKDIKNIIEEAAGIKKFQLKKLETNKNLENIENKLESVELILNEVRENKDKLEIQANNAKIFIDLKNELNKIKKTILLIEENEKNISLKDLNIKNEEAKTKVDNFRKDFNIKKERLDFIDNEQLLIKEQLLNINSKNKTLKEEIDKKEKEKIKTTEKLKNLFNEINLREEIKINLTNKLIKLQKDIENIDLIYETSLENLKLMEESNLEFENSIKNLTEEKKSINTNIYQKNSIIRDKEIERLEILNDKELSNKRKKSTLKQIEELKEDLSTLDVKLNSNIEKLKNTECDITKNNEILNKIEVEISETDNKISENSRNINRLSENIRNKEYDEKSINVKLQALKKMDENNEGLFRSVKEILNANINGVHGIVLNLIKFDEQFTKAIEVSSSYLQDIVVEDTNIAKKCIDFIKNNKLGRASFLPLNNLKVSKKYFNFQIDGVFGLLSNLLKYDEKYENIILFCFSNILVVENYDIAVKIFKENIFSGTIVTLDGELINSKGRISGGENQKSTISQIIERKKEIELLNIRYKKLIFEINEDKKTRDYLSSELEQLENKSSILTDKEDLIYKQNKKLLLDKKEIEDIIEKLKLDKERVLVSIKDEEKYFNEYEKKLKNSENEEQNLQNFVEKLKIEVQVFEKNIKDLDEKITNIENSYSDSRIKYLNTKDKLENLKNDKLRLENDIEELRKNLDETLSFILNIKNEIEELSIIEKELLDFLEKNMSIYHSENKEIERLNNQEIQYSEEQRKVLKEKAEIESYLLHAEDEYEKVKEKSQTLQKEIENIELELNELKDADFYSLEEYKLKILRDNFKSIDNKIKNFGNVNLLSIEEFKLLKEKYDFISRERDDVVRSKKTLLDMLEELDEIIFEKFNDAYSQININFNKMCSETIDNTIGNLELINSENFEEAGIEIVVKFKDKKRQTLSLLSGGEKSMVAVSFIMAIFMYKPSPFTFLDEIEAALDKKNIVKLINKLKDFTEKSQFILITHNDQTMYESDSIIGVTMDKKEGLSRIEYLSINKTGEKYGE